MKRKTKGEKLAEARVDRAFNATCNGIQIGILDLSKVMAHGVARVAAGDDDAALGASLRAYCQIISKN